MVNMTSSSGIGGKRGFTPCLNIILSVDGEEDENAIDGSVPTTPGSSHALEECTNSEPSETEQAYHQALDGRLAQLFREVQKCASPTFESKPSAFDSHDATLTFSSLSNLSELYCESFTTSPDETARVVQGRHVLHLKRGCYALCEGANTESKSEVDTQSHILAILKPEDEARGMSYTRVTGGGNHGAKDGIPPNLEAANETIASRLFPELPAVRAINKLLETNFNFAFLEDTMCITVPTTVSPFPKTVTIQRYIPGTMTFKKLGSEQQAEEVTFTKLGDRQQKVTVIFKKLAKEQEEYLNNVSCDQFQTMAICDLSLCNTDRNSENILIRDVNNTTTSTTQDFPIYPIDHALILPGGFASVGTFCWQSWPVAQRPFAASAKARIGKMNFNDDAARIRRAYPEYPAEHLEVMQITYHLVQHGVLTLDCTPFELSILLCTQPGSIPRNLLQEWYKEARKSCDDPEQVAATMSSKITAALTALHNEFSVLQAQAHNSVGLQCACIDYLRNYRKDEMA